MPSQNARVGARTPDLVPVEIRALLESGEPSANHMEQIAMDMGNLLTHQFPELDARATEVRNAGLVVRMRAGGAILYEEFGIGVVETCDEWTSDTARGWAAMVVGHAPNLDLEERLKLIRPFAADSHFAVREWAWLSLRPHVTAELGRAIGLLAAWTFDPAPNLRRFASEVTRPRGVWSVHIPALKQEPALAIPILNPLRADKSRYVQDSVANWLNDASKSQAAWVEEVCQQWIEESGANSTRRICHRGRRTLRKGEALP